MFWRYGFGEVLRRPADRRGRSRRCDRTEDLAQALRVPRFAMEIAGYDDKTLRQCVIGKGGPGGNSGEMYQLVFDLAGRQTVRDRLEIVIVAPREERLKLEACGSGGLPGIRRAYPCAGRLTEWSDRCPSEGMTDIAGALIIGHLDLRPGLRLGTSCDLATDAAGPR